MLKDISSYDGIYLACGTTDLRHSVDGLGIIIKQQFKMDVFGNYLFLFCNRRRNRLKGLCWDKNGFILYYKRLDGEGARFKWPNDPNDVRNISLNQLELLMNGLSIDPPKGFEEIKARDFC
ncbi:IS66 family insertion sequence element accessory protein TnpB [Desulfitobacterium sp.]|uniref:IS66 family transposase ISBaps1 n=1 Tax=bioreactor metagenome TaxID=1076179 RepID=A0A645G9R4_9ZZZZ|nr:IS66 family insertion sequence element accessory protein TnpB [Desulfitobacterium sp.]MEA4903035.1 IS66 family insertion sequence element accessory protein TnpB [Desulfitobacterium sp.]